MKLKIGNKSIESPEVLPLLKTEPAQQISKRIQRIREGLTDSLIRQARKSSPNIQSLNDVPEYNKDGLFEKAPKPDEAPNTIPIGIYSPLHPFKRSNMLNDGGEIK